MQIPILYTLLTLRISTQNLSARILVTSYWLFVVLMLATFTANLAAFLTVEKMQVRDLCKNIKQISAVSEIFFSAGADQLNGAAGATIQDPLLVC
jgi:hypothetical protein